MKKTENDSDFIGDDDGRGALTDRYASETGGEEPYDDSIYNEDFAKKAVGSLFDDDDDGQFVTGFDKPREAETPDGGRGIPTKTRVRPASGLSDSVHVSNYEDNIEDDIEVERPYDYHKRDRSKEPAPTPKPAVRVNTAGPLQRPSQPPKTGAPAGRRGVSSRSDDFDDDFNTFRSHGKKPESQGHHVSPARSSALDRFNRPRGYDYEDEPISPVRWVAAALTFVFLIILAILIYRLNGVTGDLKEARAALEAAPTETVDVTELRLRIDALEMDVLDKDAEIESLKEQLASGQPAGPDPLPIDDNPGRPGDTDPVETPPPTPSTPTLPAVYTVVRGDTLSGIATRFYGSAGTDNVNKIKNANGLTSDTIQIGDVLNIPE